MPTNRTFRGRRGGQGELTPGQLAWLRGDLEGYHSTLTPWEWPGDIDVDRMIDEYGERFLKEWVREHPGTRPFWWWDHVDLPEARRRQVGGIGEPRPESTFMFELTFGVPDRRSWNALGRVKYDGPLTGVPIDPTDPPVFESQAAFLDRHDLFLPGERARLSGADFAPVSVLAIVPFDDDDLLLDAEWARLWPEKFEPAQHGER
jgi:hypothetical protein